MDRRLFLRNTALLLGTCGISSSFRLDLMERLYKTVLPEVEAATTQPRRLLEIGLRSGIPVMMFATGREFAQLSMPRYSAFAYSPSEILKSERVSNLYFNVDSQALLPYAEHIAITQGVQTLGGHTNNFNYREGGFGKNKITPAVELANRNTTQSLLHGALWLRNSNSPELVNVTEGAQDLIRTNPDSFTGLFKVGRLKFTGEELNTIIQAANSLSQKQVENLEFRLKNAGNHAATYSKAMNLFSTDYSSLLSTQNMDSAFLSGNHRYARTGIAQSLKAFEHNLLNSATVTILLGDWHNRRYPGDISPTVAELSQLFAATIQHMQATPDTAAGPGKTLWDTTVIAVGSEFTRGISPLGLDNSDGGTQGIMLIGKNIRGNYYGSFTLQDTENPSYGQAHGIDPVTGQALTGQRNTTEQVYHTIRKALDLPVTGVDNDKVLKAMLRS